MSRRSDIPAYNRAYYKNNRDKVLAVRAAYVAQNYEEVRRKAKVAHYRKKYGITIEQRDAVVKKQKHRCLICNKKKPLVVDHCHATGKFRGMLCHFCNRWLGIHEAWRGKWQPFEAYLKQVAHARTR